MHLLNENYSEKEATVERLKREIEKLHKRLSEMEMQNDQLDIKKKSAEKQSEIQRKQLLEKISNLNEVISHEKDTREQWIQRYEKEQKNHMQTSNELLMLKGSLQDHMLKVKNLEIVVESLTKQRDLMKFNNQELQRNITEMMAKKESAERELFSKSELLRTVEEHHMIFVRKLKEDTKAFGVKKDWEIHGKEMEIEDLRSYTRHLYDTNDKHKSLLFETRAKLLE